MFLYALSIHFLDLITLLNLYTDENNKNLRIKSQIGILGERRERIMKHHVKIYPGKYEIVPHKNIIYLHQKSENMRPKDFRFYDRYKNKGSDKGYNEEIIRTIVELDVDNDQELMKFLQSYGLLINVLSDPESPNYCGKPISKETLKYLCPFSSGIALPRFLFKHNMKLLRNVFLLSTELSKSECKNPDFDTKKNSIDILELFLRLLFQPYTIWENTVNQQIVIVGITPLSRFASSFHEGTKCIPSFFVENFLTFFVEKFKKIVNENSYQKDNIPSISEPPKEEADIPVFEPTARFCEFAEATYNGKSTSLILIFPEIFYEDTATDDYRLLSKTLSSINKYCKYSVVRNGYFKLFFKDEKAFISDTQLLDDLRKLSKQLVIDTLNTYTSNIQFKIDHFNENDLTVEEKEKYIKTKNEYINSNPYMYSFTYRSPSLLQALFLEASSMLNEYGVGICAHPGCDKLIFYKRTRPKSCCSPSHATIVSRSKKKNLKNN